MSKAWTTREQKDCAAAYSTEGIDAAIAITGRTKASIYRMMGIVGVKSAYNRHDNLVKQSWFAEEIAFIFELVCSGISNKIISEYYNTSREHIDLVIRTAKARGFDAYPLRNNQ
jgi:hypothetical protein